MTEWLKHTPKSVVAENFRVPPEVLDTLPKSEKVRYVYRWNVEAPTEIMQYIFQGELPGSIDEEKPKTFKKSKLKFTHKMLDQTPEVTSGGRVRITDSHNFPISKTVSTTQAYLAHDS